MLELGQLRGKTVAITGASRGIGKAAAEHLSRFGVNLVLGARNLEGLDAVSAAIESPNLALPLDVTSENSVQHFAAAAVEQFGKVDALINSAGVGTFETVLSLSVEEFDRMLSVNLRGTFLCCKNFGAYMVKQGYGQIINLVSIAGTTALPGCGGYSASKFGVLGLTKVLQTELRAKGVNVTAVLPGAVATPFWDNMQNKPDLSAMIPVQTLSTHLVYLLCQPAGAVIDEMTIMPPLGIL